MCGIAGYLLADDGVAPNLEAMVDSLRRRGPDQADHVGLDRGGLGAARLSLVGGACGRQPRRRRGSGSLFVMNGEVYDWHERAEEAGLDVRSDTAFAHEMVEIDIDRARRFRGGFALAWMSPAGDRLVLATDAFGQRPLYYTERDGRFIFASTLGALAAAGSRFAVDDDDFADLLALQFYRPGRTLARSVRRLQPGAVLRVERRSGRLVSRLRRDALTLTPDASVHATSSVLRSTPGVDDDVHRDDGNDPASAVRALFLESARLQGLGGPASLALSGGLDSTAVLGALAHADRRPAHAIVGRFDEGESYDEAPFARAAARAYDVPLTEFTLDATTWGAAIEETVLALEMPVAGPGSVSQFLLARQVASTSRIFLSGQGGDEFFGGYERFRLLQDLTAGATAPRDVAYRPLFDRMHAVRDGGPAAMWWAALDRRGTLARLLDLPPTTWAGAEERWRATMTSTTGSASTSTSTQPMTWPARALAFERDVLLPGLLHVDDRLCGWFGMEGRSPFLDQPLVSRLLAVAPDDASPPSEPRHLFRRALGDLLPAPVRDRRDKRGFPIPLAQWFGDPLRDFVRDVLMSRASLERGYLRRDAIERHLDDDGAAGRATFLLLALEFWHRLFVDHDVSSHAATAARPGVRTSS